MPPRKRRASNQGDECSKDLLERLTSVSNTSSCTNGDRGARTKGKDASTNVARLTARQQSKQEQAIALASASAAVAVAEQSSGTGTCGPPVTVRQSGRIVKRPKRDLSPPESPVKRARGAKVSNTPETKTKRQWELWSVEDKNSFFEALFEFGKDFDAIHNLIIAKCKRRGILPNVMKNKEQVRHFYYRTWHKISKIIEPLEGVKKEVLELYGLICYGVMRKKIRRGFNSKDKNWQKLNELVHQGATTVKAQGKKFRIKTPICTALKKANNVEEPRKDDNCVKLPDKIHVEFRPKTNEAWARVQEVAQNPRLRITVKPDRRFSSLVTFLEKKWKPHRLKLKEQMQEEEAPVKELCVFPNRDCTMTCLRLVTHEEPKLHFSLDKYRDRILTHSPSANKGKRSVAVDSQKSMTANENSLEAVEPVIYLPEHRDCIKTSNSSVECSAASKPLDDTRTSMIGDVSAIAEGENAMFPDDMLPQTKDSMLTVSEQHDGSVMVQVDSVKTEDETPTNCNTCRSDQQSGESLPAGSELESTRSVNKRVFEDLMKNGWNSFTSSQATVAELYLMFGKDNELRFEYEWCNIKTNPSEQCLLTNLTNLLRRLANLATVEFTDFGKPASANSPCRLCGVVSGRNPKGQAKGRSPTTAKGAAKTHRDISTQTKPLPVLNKNDTSNQSPKQPNHGFTPDGVFRVPVAGPAQKSLHTLTDKELVQRLNPNFNKPTIRPRKLKSVSRNVMQRTVLPILPKAQPRQVVTFLPMVAGPQVNSNCSPLTSTQLVSKTITSQGTIIGQPVQLDFTVASTDVNLVHQPTATALVTTSASSHTDSQQMQINEVSQAVAGVSSATICQSPSNLGFEMALSPNNSHSLMTMEVPATQDNLLSSRGEMSPGLAVNTATATNVSPSTSLSSISPPNIASLLDISFSNISTPGQDGDKFMEGLSIDSTTTEFTGLLDGESSKELPVERGLITPPPMRRDSQFNTPPHSPPVRSLFKMSSPVPDSHWLNGELSLTSFLESPLKSETAENQVAAQPSSSMFVPQTLNLFSESSRDSIGRLDVDSTLISMMNESSMDYVKKFADLAEHVAQGEHNSIKKSEPGGPHG